MKIKDIRIEQTSDGMWLSFKGTNQAVAQLFNKYSPLITNGKPLSLEVKQDHKKRSNDANRYMWVLIEKIAISIESTSIEVYKGFVHNVGKRLTTPISNDEIDSWTQAWEHNGVGWFCEEHSKCNTPGYTNITNYFGSSVYDTKQMSRIINEVISECKILDIEVISDEELEHLIENWR